MNRNEEKQEKLNTFKDYQKCRIKCIKMFKVPVVVKLHIYSIFEDLVQRG